MSNFSFTLGHSPDPDDAFMFYALARDKVPNHGIEFTHQLEGIQTLNERALRGELDVSAISFHAYPYICAQYALLPCGASMGDGYGPLLVATRSMTRDEIRRARIAIPGRMTSAFLALQLWLDTPASALNLVEVEFDKIFDTVRTNQAEVGLVIHEGQLTFENEGLVSCCDLGIWWGQTQDGLPLPLGGNVIHKRIPPTLRSQISDLISSSIRFSLEHRQEAVMYALQYARDMEIDLADRFVGMYVNHWTVDYGDKGRESILRFLRMGASRQLVPSIEGLEFV